MSYELDECIRMLLTFSRETSVKADIRHGKVNYTLSYNDSTDNIDQRSAECFLRLSSGESYHTLYFKHPFASEGCMYKVRERTVVCDGVGKEELVKATRLIEIEKCHSLK